MVRQYIRTVRTKDGHIDVRRLKADGYKVRRLVELGVSNTDLIDEGYDEKLLSLIVINCLEADNIIRLGEACCTKTVIKILDLDPPLGAKHYTYLQHLGYNADKILHLREAYCTKILNKMLNKGWSMDDLKSFGFTAGKIQRLGETRAKEIEQKMFEKGWKPNTISDFGLPVYPDLLGERIFDDSHPITRG